MKQAMCEEARRFLDDNFIGFPIIFQRRKFDSN